MAPLVWLNSACNCWTVSCISLQSAGSLLLCQEYRRTARKCQRYSQKWLCTLSVISQIIIGFRNCYIRLISFLFLSLWKALLSLFLTAYRYSHRYQSHCHRRLPNLNFPYFEWHWMSSLDIYMSASNPKQSRVSSSGSPFGAAPPRFQLGVVAWRNSLSSIPPTFPFTVCKPWLSARGMVLVALTAEYQECLKAGPFDVHYQCISAWLHCDCSTRMRCVDTFCWHLSLIYLYREDAWNAPVSYFFLDVVISLSLNNTALNILNDVLKIHGLVGNLRKTKWKKMMMMMMKQRRRKHSKCPPWKKKTLFVSLVAKPEFKTYL